MDWTAVWCARFLVEKAEQVKTASIISAEGHTEAADLLASAFAKAGEGLVSNIPTYIVQGAGAALKWWFQASPQHWSQQPFVLNIYRLIDIAD